PQVPSQEDIGMRVTPLIFAICSAALLYTPQTLAQETPASVPADDATILSWFVEIDGNKNSVRAAARSAGIEFTERFEFNTLWRGVSVNTTATHAAALKSIKGVTAVYPVEQITLSPIDGDASAPQLVSAIHMSGAAAVQAGGFDGTGVKVGVIDSGIDFDHPDLGG